jgi:hypothetical protein
MWEKGLLKPAVFEKEYKGLESVVTTMKDLSARKVWGKAGKFILILKCRFPIGSWELSQELAYNSLGS